MYPALHSTIRDVLNSLLVLVLVSNQELGTGGPEECSQAKISQVKNIFHTWDNICVQCCKNCNLLLIYNTVHITDYFQFIFSRLPPDLSN